MHVTVVVAMLATTACSSSDDTSGSEGGAAGADGSQMVDAPPGPDAGTVIADAGRTDASSAGAVDSKGSLVPGSVCGGEPKDCPAHPAPASACTRAGHCCVYQESPSILTGCTCDQSNHWVCANQLCGCVGTTTGCGTKTCTGSEICVQPCCGGAPPQCLPLPDGGTCPSGSVACSAGRPGCYTPCVPPPAFCHPRTEPLPGGCRLGNDGQVICLCA